MTLTDAATFCATLVDEWCRAGVTAAFVAPGSRSTPLALALAADRRITVEIVHDERSAAFAALGHGLASGDPAVVLCSSGTAGAHFHAAVIEADASGVPLLACTADRPPELWDIGAPQTIDQTHLFGRSVRWYAEPGVPDAATASSWRSVGSRLVAEARGWSGRAGPVHLNASFRDPLAGVPAELPPGRPDGRPWHREWLARPHRIEGGDPEAGHVVSLLMSGGRIRPGAVIAGRGADDPEAIHQLADRLGWPVLADHRSGCRDDGAVRYFDALLRSPGFAHWVEPEIVIRFGEALSSKSLSQWIDRSAPESIAALGPSRWIDPERVAGTVVQGAGAARALLDSLPGEPLPDASARRWAAADEAAAKAASEVLSAASTSGAGTVNEISVCAEAIDRVPSGGALVVSSSMPVRDVEWYGPNRCDIEVFANRGANGIDGVISTAIGVASTGVPTTVLIGDVAFLHDSSALTGLVERAHRRAPFQLDIVVIDNDGGGIFSFLPQAEQLEPAAFEHLFGTPHGTDLLALGRAHHLPSAPWPLPVERVGPVQLIVASTDRAANVEVHRRVNEAVAEAAEAVVTAGGETS